MKQTNKYIAALGKPKNYVMIIYRSNSERGKLMKKKTMIKVTLFSTFMKQLGTPSLHIV